MILYPWNWTTEVSTTLLGREKEGYGTVAQVHLYREKCIKKKRYVYFVKTDNVYQNTILKNGKSNWRLPAFVKTKIEPSRLQRTNQY